jgi:hypothetical protein
VRKYWFIEYRFNSKIEHTVVTSVSEFFPIAFFVRNVVYNNPYELLHVFEISKSDFDYLASNSYNHS